jgi:hypothetical protein
LVRYTTWEHESNEFIGPRIGLPELPVIEFGLDGTRWKFGQPTLLHEVDPHHGLRARDLDAIQQWAAHLAATPSET